MGASRTSSSSSTSQQQGQQQGQQALQRAQHRQNHLSHHALHFARQPMSHAGKAAPAAPGLDLGQGRRARPIGIGAGSASLLAVREGGGGQELAMSHRRRLTGDVEIGRVK